MTARFSVPHAKDILHSRGGEASMDRIDRRENDAGGMRIMIRAQT